MISLIWVYLKWSCSQMSRNRHAKIYHKPGPLMLALFFILLIARWGPVKVMWFQQSHFFNFPRTRSFLGGNLIQRDPGKVEQMGYGGMVSYWLGGFISSLFCYKKKQHTVFGTMVKCSVDPTFFGSFIQYPIFRCTPNIIWLVRFPIIYIYIPIKSLLCVKICWDMHLYSHDIISYFFFELQHFESCLKTAFAQVGCCICNYPVILPLYMAMSRNAGTLGTIRNRLLLEC